MNHRFATTGEKIKTKWYTFFHACYCHSFVYTIFGVPFASNLFLTKAVLFMQRKKDELPTIHCQLSIVNSIYVFLALAASHDLRTAGLKEPRNTRIGQVCVFMKVGCNVSFLDFRHDGYEYLPVNL